MLKFQKQINLLQGTGSCHNSGIGPDEPIGIPSDLPARWISVARAMAIQENGTAQIDDFAMLKGFDLARQDAK